MGRRDSAVVGLADRVAMTERVRALRQQCPTMIGLDLCVSLWSGWRGLRAGRCGLVARVPQDRMLSRSVTLNGRDGKARFGERLIKLKVQNSKLKG
jgi:hypothetical protein